MISKSHFLDQPTVLWLSTISFHTTTSHHPINGLAPVPPTLAVQRCSSRIPQPSNTNTLIHKHTHIQILKYKTHKYDQWPGAGAAQKLEQQQLTTLKGTVCRTRDYQSAARRPDMKLHNYYRYYNYNYNYYRCEAAQQSGEKQSG